ncbi:MAG: hypothetical protein VX641_07245 [Planctomycetota bacterium]|nr:hypothetical protein [Planctomycetota bacterium]
MTGSGTRAGWWLLALGGLILGGISLSVPSRLPLTDPILAPLVEGGRRPVAAPLDLDPFTATPAELCLLPGIGPRLARRLHREIHHRGLTDLDQLTQVVDIGPGRVEAIRRVLSPRRGH